MTATTVAHSIPAPAARNSGKVDDIVEFARRTRIDLVLFALPISAETRILEMPEEIVGAAGRHPAFRSHQQAALPSPAPIPISQGPNPRCLRGADHRLGSGDEVAVRHFVGAVILLLATPLMLLVALAIRLDSPGRCCSARSGSASTTSASGSAYRGTASET